jgi:hypothetical protein
LDTAYTVTAAVVVLYCTFSAVMDFIRYQPILDSMAAAGVPSFWLPGLGAAKGAGAVGLLLGLLGVPLVGTAALIGIVLFFLGAILTHLRAGDRGYGLAAGFLTLALAALALDLAR